MVTEALASRPSTAPGRSLVAELIAITPLADMWEASRDLDLR